MDKGIKIGSKALEPKSGYKTTEFWAMIISVAFGMLILFGVITNSQSNTMLAYVNNIMGSLVTIVSVASYILSRGKAKQNTTMTIDYDKLLEDIKQIVNKD